MMMRALAVTAAIVAGMACAAAAQTTAPDPTEIYKANQDAVVWVTAVSKVQGSGMGVPFGHGSESKIDVMGTIIDPSGLTVVSYTALDPMSMMEGAEIRMDGENKKMDFKAEFSDVKILQPDGTEIPARLVLKDLDLDLAFILPEENDKTKGKVFPCVKLAGVPDGQVLDEVVCVARLGKSLDRQPMVVINRISAVVRKPRVFYQVENFARFGAPVFLRKNGALLGIGTLRKAAGPPSFYNMMGGDAPTPIVLPADEIADLAKQALARKDQKETTPKSAPAKPEAKVDGKDDAKAKDAPAPKK